MPTITGIGRDPELERSSAALFPYRPSADIWQHQRRLSRTEFTQNESSHFTLKYEGRQTPESFRRDLVSTLESHYGDLVRDLGVAPRGSIAVILYTDQLFSTLPITLMGGRGQRWQAAHSGQRHEFGSLSCHAC